MRRSLRERPAIARGRRAARPVEPQLRHPPGMCAGSFRVARPPGALGCRGGGRRIQGAAQAEVGSDIARALAATRRFEEAAGWQLNSGQS
eukprot:1984250-Lingulodinium_polyedra.AAC.1